MAKTKIKTKYDLTTTSRRLGIPLVLLLLAHALRTSSLNWQSFWLDEVYAVWFIDRPFIEALHLIITPSNNGPLYFLLLWFWHRLAGPSDFAIRYFSTLCSVLTVSTLWQLGRQWFDKRVASWAALLFTLSPFALWFGQEAKMYALHMLLATLTTLMLTRALKYNRWQQWAGYGILINFLGYSHFFGAFTIAAQGIVALISTLPHWRRIRSYLITMLLVIIPYLPLLRYGLQVLSNYQPNDPSKQFVPLFDALGALATNYSLRLNTSQSPDWLPIVVALIVLTGLVRAWQRDLRMGVWLTGLLLLPIAVFYPVSMHLKIFAPKYLNAIFPLFLLAIALTIEALHRWGKIPFLIGTALLLSSLGLAITRDLTQPAFQRTNWRFAANYLTENAEPNDVIVTYVDYIDRVLKHYYHSNTPIRPYPYDPATPELLYDELAAENFQKLWLVLSHDRLFAPDHRLIEAANNRYPQITGQYPSNGQIQIVGFTMQWRHASLPQSATPVNARFQNGLKLVGFETDARELLPVEAVSHPPSNWIHVVGYWQREGEAKEENQDTPVMLLLGENGGIWGRALTRTSTVFKHDPPANWGTDTIVESHFDVNINPATPSGNYKLVVIIETPAGEQVPLAQAETPQAALCTIKILDTP
ncbi:MAG: glycosyltransferase family 39 protein [Chloroflexota bacterium]|nr:glycosyltransferase family 39 protein [Chloroflexota bacterium]